MLGVEIENEKVEMLPEKALFWPRKKTLLLADLHLGKINHFRKAGVPVPPPANQFNLGAFIAVMQACRPERTVFMGDLFHSHYNDEWEALKQVIGYFPECVFDLVIGNHDILSPWQYQRLGIRIHARLLLEPFVLTHHPLEPAHESLYNLAGHIHPGVRLTGRGRQALTLPCFYFGERHGLLPAFGTFTGLHRLSVKKGDRIFVIAEKKVIQL